MQAQTEPGGRGPAPDGLRLVQQFINSLDIEAGTDEFTSPRALGSWLHDHGLTKRRTALSQRDLTRARSFREALRSLALAHNEEPLSAETRAALERGLERLRFGVEWDPRRGLRFDTVNAGVDEAIGRLVAIVHEETIRGRWARMKACARDECRWVFYDHSRNRAGTWCSMAVCGSRIKVSAYYRRRRERSQS